MMEKSSSPFSKFSRRTIVAFSMLTASVGISRSGSSESYVTENNTSQTSQSTIDSLLASKRIPNGSELQMVLIDGKYELFTAESAHEALQNGDMVNAEPQFQKTYKLSSRIGTYLDGDREVYKEQDLLRIAYPDIIKLTEAIGKNFYNNFGEELEVTSFLQPVEYHLLTKPGTLDRTFEQGFVLTGHGAEYKYEINSPEQERWLQNVLTDYQERGMIRFVKDSINNTFRVLCIQKN